MVYGVSGEKISVEIWHLNRKKVRNNLMIDDMGYDKLFWEVKMICRLIRKNRCFDDMVYDK